MCVYVKHIYLYIYIYIYRTGGAWRARASGGSCAPGSV